MAEQSAKHKGIFVSLRKSMQALLVNEVCDDISEENFETIRELEESIIESSKHRIAVFLSITPRTFRQCIDLVRNEVVPYLSELSSRKFIGSGLAVVQASFISLITAEADQITGGLQKHLESLVTFDEISVERGFGIKNSLSELFEGKELLRGPNILQVFLSPASQVYENAVRMVLKTYKNAESRIDIRRLFAQHYLQDAYSHFKVIHCLDPSIEFFKTQLKPLRVSAELQEEINQTITDSSLSKKFIDQMGDVVAFVSKFRLTGDALNLDESVVTEQVRKFKESCELLNEHKKTFRLLTGKEVQVEQYQSQFSE